MVMSILRLWRIKRRRITDKIVWLSILLSASVNAVELDQLHLPKSYLKYLPRLLDGARLMEGSEQCHKFLSGTVKLDASTLDHPVFVYTCRDKALLTYRWLVDGQDLMVLDDTRPEGRISFADIQKEAEEERRKLLAIELERQARIEALQAERAQIERLRQQERGRRITKELSLREIRRRVRLWQECLEDFQYQTKNMAGVTLLTREQPEAIERSPAPSQVKNSEGSQQSEEVVVAREPGQTHRDNQTLAEDAVEKVQALRFILDFDARDLYDQPLRYRAYCDVSEDDTLTLTIHPRALAEDYPRGSD